MKFRIQLLIILYLLIFHRGYAQKQDSLLNQHWLTLKEVLLRKANHVKELSNLLSKFSKINKTIPENAQNFAELFTRTINAVERINNSSIGTINIQNRQLSSMTRRLLTKALNHSKSKQWSDLAIELAMQLEG